MRFFHRGDGCGKVDGMSDLSRVEIPPPDAKSSPRVSTAVGGLPSLAWSGFDTHLTTLSSAIEMTLSLFSSKQALLIDPS